MYHHIYLTIIFYLLVLAQKSCLILINVHLQWVLFYTLISTIGCSINSYLMNNHWQNAVVFPTMGSRKLYFFKVEKYGIHWSRQKYLRNELVFYILKYKSKKYQKLRVIYHCYWIISHRMHGWGWGEVTFLLFWQGN